MDQNGTKGSDYVLLPQRPNPLEYVASTEIWPITSMLQDLEMFNLHNFCKNRTGHSISVPIPYRVIRIAPPSEAGPALCLEIAGRKERNSMVSLFVENRLEHLHPFQSDLQLRFKANTTLKSVHDCHTAQHSSKASCVSL